MQCQQTWEIGSASDDAGNTMNALAIEGAAASYGDLLHRTSSSAPCSLLTLTTVYLLLWSYHRVHRIAGPQGSKSAATLAPVVWMDISSEIRAARNPVEIENLIVNVSSRLRRCGSDSGVVVSARTGRATI
ncbi:hypothetical protein BDV09DRAFT_180498 [Aspergillus tetrazonus]